MHQHLTKLLLAGVVAMAVLALGFMLIPSPAWAAQPDKTTLGKLGCAPDQVAVKDGVDGSTWTCVTGGAKYVFVTLEANRGNFPVPAWEAVCDFEASGAKLAPGDYVAWLSTSTIDARDALPPGPFFTPIGDLVAMSKADLLDGRLINPIDVSAGGLSVGIPSVWTGTAQDGTAKGVDCAGWTSESPGLLGSSGDPLSTELEWTDSFNINCFEALPIYCVQVN